MPRAEKLSSRLETLIEDIFASPTDPFALYWSIAAQISHNQLAAVQTKIRKTLRQRGEIGAESAVLLACVLHLTGFPAHRLLHFLSLYIPGGIRLSLFELAVSAIFLGEPPIPAQMLYDLTVSWVGKKRLPSTAANPEAYRVTSYSPPFFLVNGQVTRSLFAGLDLYLGVENLFDFRQGHPIVSAADPSGPYFDSSLIWGPVSGRMVYGGVRWRM